MRRIAALAALTLLLGGCGAILDAREAKPVADECRVLAREANGRDRWTSSAMEAGLTYEQGLEMWRRDRHTGMAHDWGICLEDRGFTCDTRPQVTPPQRCSWGNASIANPFL